MPAINKWIWLPRELYPEQQTTIYSAMAADKSGLNMTVAELKRDYEFASQVTLYPDTKELHLRAEVRMGPALINEYSRGHGGFMLASKLTLADGRVKYICTDSSWAVRCLRGHVGACKKEPTDCRRRSG